MRKGETTKPCPGCGEEGLRDADNVCQRCQRLLQEARQARERQAQDTERQVYDVPATFPWYSVPASYQSQGATRTALESIRAMMVELVHSIGTPAVGDALYNVATKLFTFPKGRRVEYSSYDSRLCLAPETARAIDHLDTAIQTALQVAYEAGKQDGAHLLQQLASGEITIAAFNEETMKSK